MKKFIQCLSTIAVFILLILIMYVFTDAGYNDFIMPVSGIPMFVGAFISIIIIPLCVYASFEEEYE